MPQAAGRGEEAVRRDGPDHPGRQGRREHPVPGGQETVPWGDVSGLPKGGLPPGTYGVELELSRSSFTVERPARRAEVLERPAELERLLGGRAHPLYLQVTVEHLLAQKDQRGDPRPYLADALDVLDALQKELNAAPVVIARVRLAAP